MKTQHWMFNGLIAATMIFSASCGGLEPQDSATSAEPTALTGDVGQQEYHFKHGPPPGDPPYDYFLTAYGGGADPNANGTPACGGKKVDGTWYYSTGAYTFGCGAKLLLQANNKCVVVKVVENGPAAWVENKAKNRCGNTGYIIDASPLVAKHLFNSNSAGWSDCFGIQVTPVDAGTATGVVTCPANSSDSDPEVDWGAPEDLENGSAGDNGAGDPEAGTDLSGPTDLFIGEACAADQSCASNECLSDADGYYQGMCTESCTKLCPDQAGQPTTFCIAPDGVNGQCVSRCDTRYYATGCRAGYTCVKMPRHNQPWVKRNVCVPGGGKADALSEPADAEGNLPNPEQGGGMTAGCSWAGAGLAGQSAPTALLLLLLAAGAVLVRGRGKRR